MPVERLDHFLVLTDDIDSTRDFWVAAFGFEVGDRPPLPFPGHWLYGADAKPCVHIADRGAYTAHAETMGLSVPGGSGGPIDHVAFMATDYDGCVARLASCGAAYVPNFIPGPDIRQLFVDDPNGVRVELNVPPGS
jgi:catechol 2,3-dioxygenase-like lactoylglutathione lyase family enzyme